MRHTLSKVLHFLGITHERHYDLASAFVTWLSAGLFAAAALAILDRMMCFPALAVVGGTEPNLRRSLSFASRHPPVARGGAHVVDLPCIAAGETCRCASGGVQRPRTRSRAQTKQAGSRSATASRDRPELRSGYIGRLTWNARFLPVLTTCPVNLFTLLTVRRSGASTG